MGLMGLRHKMSKKLGANEQLLRNGMSKDNSADNPVPPFSEPKKSQYYGPLETISIKIHKR